MKRRFAVGFLCLFGILTGRAQDHIYSQFYNAPVYLNPALNGQFKGDLRVNFIYRNQWTAVPGTLNYMTASLDYQLPEFNSGIGLIVNHTSEGTAFWTKNNIAGVYSYAVGSDNFNLSFGLQAGITNNRIDETKLVFSDQLDVHTGIVPGAASSAGPLQYNNRYYFDSGAGINLVVGNFMAGGAVQHLNKPNESFTGMKSPLPMRTTAYMSYRLGLIAGGYDEDNLYAIPSVVVYSQSKSIAYSAGLQVKKNALNAGIWYRNNSQGGPDAVVVSLIFDIFSGSYRDEKIRLGVSHDATTSRLGYGNTTGTTEGSIGYEVSFPNRNGGYRQFAESVKCSDFY
ncbi:type IX secretion system membrane protein PorP/SprF [Pedobacter sp. HMF7647]|uniref:Type IX secretion system membrane protein PorP/SprF n=1 Tax=Hufsiella arboris TaxID=2695275 RepID=A0A7K1Y8V7_9SPHI|nr:PorP/SprF family type IX secretion system membrane protein [Hufsiella arboris]MXV51015.1 type IX secretion system membrane protein PorP/SprF [Hufsiella arboris]